MDAHTLVYLFDCVANPASLFLHAHTHASELIWTWKCVASVMSREPNA